MTLGFLVLASRSGQSASSAENLQICKSSEFDLLCLWPLETISTSSHHGTKRIVQGSVCEAHRWSWSGQSQSACWTGSGK